MNNNATLRIDITKDFANTLTQQDIDDSIALIERIKTMTPEERQHWLDTEDERLNEDTGGGG